MDSKQSNIRRMKVEISQMEAELLQFFVDHHNHNMKAIQKFKEREVDNSK